MLLKKVTLAALAGAVLLVAAPAFADQGRGDRQQFRGNHFQGNQFRGDHFRGDRFRGGHFQRQPVVMHRPAYGHYWHRPVVVHRPAYGYYGHRPVVVDRPAYSYDAYPSHNVLGGLILGTVIGAAIANHNSY
jgi:hypothetical protein